MNSLFLSPFALLTVLPGCLAYQNSQVRAPSSVPRLDASVRLSVPLPRGAAQPYLLPETPPTSSYKQAAKRTLTPPHHPMAPYPEFRYVKRRTAPSQQYKNSHVSRLSPVLGVTPRRLSHSSVPQTGTRQQSSNLVTTSHRHAPNVRSPSLSLNSYISSLSGPRIPLMPQTALLDYWRNQNRHYISRQASSKRDWEAKTKALAAETRRLETRLNNLKTRREMQKERDQSEGAPLGGNVVLHLRPVFPVTLSRPDLDPLYPYDITQAAKDLDCDLVSAGSVGSMYYPRPCDDDTCPSRKECKNIGNVGMCCPPSVTTHAILAKAFYA